MKIQKSPIKSKNKIIIIVVAIILLLLIIAGVFFYLNRTSSPSSNAKDINSVDYGPPTTEQEDAGNQINDSKNTGSDPLPDPIPQSDGKSLVDVTITSINQDESVLRVNSLISTIDNSGTCTITLIKNDVAVKKTSEVQALPSSSTCKGFTIPLSELSKGTWELALVFENQTLTGTAKQTVEIK